ncbi:hypothetical protein BAE44_0010904 [Dichanthelium oligosanthes]|uniref:Uncharacterized protein n=1 Tax=Dichanthelium oligosanthes TaxID=888268 RepID=A0A1E5VSI5_9POAL|nr:hypothetical protein BAE44_0010904 [Dichanthelium oligosanthes]
MAAEGPWKAHVLAGVIEAGDLCVSARYRLISARRFWEEPMRVADACATSSPTEAELPIQQGGAAAPATRRRKCPSSLLPQAPPLLADVSGDLALAFAHMMTVEMLSLHDTAAHPMDPLAGVEEIPDGDNDVRQAMNTLRRAGAAPRPRTTTCSRAAAAC